MDTRHNIFPEKRTFPFSHQQMEQSKTQDVVRRDTYLAYPSRCEQFDCLVIRVWVVTEESVGCLVWASVHSPSFSSSETSLLTTISWNGDENKKIRLFFNVITSFTFFYDSLSLSLSLFEQKMNSQSTSKVLSKISKKYENLYSLSLSLFFKRFFVSTKKKDMKLSNCLPLLFGRSFSTITIEITTTTLSFFFDTYDVWGRTRGCCCIFINLLVV